MISVQVKINRKSIIKISAINKGKIKGTTVSNGWRKYKLSPCGCILKHDRNLGALCMLIQMAGHAQLCKKFNSITP